MVLILHTDSYHSIITNLKNAVHLLYYLMLHQKACSKYEWQGFA